MTSNTPTQVRMSEREKQQTYQAALTAMSIINERSEALNQYRREVLTYAADNPGNHSFTFDMSFLKVNGKLELGYMQSVCGNNQARKSRISVEAFKIAKETGASFQEVKELFLLLMKYHIIS